MLQVLNAFYNFHWVARGRVARSAQPYFGFWRQFLRGNNIAAILNLRGSHPQWRWWRREVAVCRRLSVAHYDLALNSRRLPTRERLSALFNVFDHAPKPLLIKCSGGQDRTSFASALFLIHVGGWAAFDEALGQFAAFPYLHFPQARQRWLRLFLRYAREQAAGRPLGVWVRESYDRSDLAGWLDRNGHGRSYVGLMPTGVKPPPA